VKNLKSLVILSIFALASYLVINLINQKRSEPKERTEATSRSPKKNQKDQIASIDLPSETNSASDPTQAEAFGIDEFNSNSKTRFEIRRDGLDGRVRTIYRGQFVLTGSGTKEQRVREFINEYSKGLFGVDPKNLKLSRVEGTERERFIFENEIAGIPVFGSRLIIGVEGEEIVRIQNDLTPISGELISKETVSFADAVAAYVKREEASGSKPVIGGEASKIYMPGAEQFVLAYRTVIQHPSSDEHHDQSFMLIFDARNGQVLKKIPMTITN
jgi:hypothetical protein